MNRRELLKAGGTLGVLAGLAPTAPSRANDRIGVGVIGAGVRGQLHFGFLGEVPDLELVAYCDVLPFRLDEARAKAPAAKSYSDYRRLLDDKDVDAVIVSTHFSEHLPVVLAAIDAGKHVYCEKTMIMGLDETHAVVEAAQRHPAQIFQTGFQYRTSPLYEKAGALVKSGAIGEITAVNCQWNRNGNWRRPVPDPKWERQVNWRMYREYSGGLVAELSSHQMGFCDWILGSELETIQGVGGIDYWKDGRETYDNTHVVTRYRSGVTAVYSSQTTNSLGGYRIVVMGKDGTLILTTQKGWIVPEGEPPETPEGIDLVSGASVMSEADNAYRLSDGRAALRVDAPEGEPTPVALQLFADAIHSGRQPVSDVRNGAKLSALVQLSNDAMRENRIIAWEPRFDFDD